MPRGWVPSQAHPGIHRLPAGCPGARARCWPAPWSRSSGREARRSCRRSWTAGWRMAWSARPARAPVRWYRARRRVWRRSRRQNRPSTPRIPECSWFPYRSRRGILRARRSGIRPSGRVRTASWPAASWAGSRRCRGLRGWAWTPRCSSNTCWWRRWRRGPRPAGRSVPHDPESCRKCRAWPSADRRRRRRARASPNRSRCPGRGCPARSPACPSGW